MQTRALILTLAAVTALNTAVLAGARSASAADSSSPTTDASNKKQMRAENRALSHEVRKSLTKVKGLDSSRISVLARGGIVTLAGSAPDQSQIESAASAAGSVAGVSHVDNRLTVYEPGN